MPADRKQRRTEYGITYNTVDAREPTYRCPREFLAAVAAHFAADRPVTLIDLRGFGLWGEWHSGHRFSSLHDRREALKRVIDVWSAAFANHHLALCYSHDPDGPTELYDGPVFGFDETFTGSA